MKFTMTKIVASIAFAISGGNAQAVLNSTNTLSIQADAVLTNIGDVFAQTWVVSSDGPLVDSFFTLGGSKTKLGNGLDTQYSYFYSSTGLTLSGAPQANIASFNYYSNPGELQTVGTGISILSASGDTATVDMSGLIFNSAGSPIPAATGAWPGYTNGVGNIVCETGSECAIGSAYTLQYTSKVPIGDPSGFGAVKFYFELHGTVGAVPEASTYSMMLVGLGLLGVAVRRRRTH